MTKIKFDFSDLDFEASLLVGVDDPTYRELVALLKDRGWPMFPNGPASFGTVCPVCENGGSRSPSLSISRGRDGRALLYCHSGKEGKERCGLDAPAGRRNRRDVARAFDAFRTAEVPKAVVRRTGAKPGVNPDWMNAHPLKLGATETARYVYPNGRVKVRYEWPNWGKDFRWPRGKGEPMLYRPPSRVEKRHYIVVLVEGEKDTDQLRGLGFVATTPSEGKLTRALARKYLKGAEVAILWDHDAHGRKARDAALSALDGVAKRAYAVELPGLREVKHSGEDVSDWLDNHGGTRRKLRALLDAASERAAQ